MFTIHVIVADMADDLEITGIQRVKVPFYDVIERCAGFIEARLQIGEHLFRLGSETPEPTTLADES
jgi:hypothetical protein